MEVKATAGHPVFDDNFRTEIWRRGETGQHGKAVMIVATDYSKEKLWGGSTLRVLDNATQRELCRYELGHLDAPGVLLAMLVKAGSGWSLAPALRPLDAWKPYDAQRLVKATYGHPAPGYHTGVVYVNPAGKPTYLLYNAKAAAVAVQVFKGADLIDTITVPGKTFYNSATA